MINIDSLDFKSSRYERKFFITELNLKEAESIIRFNSFMFKEIFYKRRVNNIYLDSQDFESYLDNIEGNNKRVKIRIRWYGGLFGNIEKPVLEIKIKNNELGKKLSFPLKSFVLNQNFSLGLLQKKVFSKSKLPEWVKEILKLCKPALLNSYKRKYFMAPDKKYRITLDDSFVFFKIYENNNSFNDVFVDENSVILELKYDKKDDFYVSQITQEFPFRMTKSSKYVSGIFFLEE